MNTLALDFLAINPSSISYPLCDHGTDAKSELKHKGLKVFEEFADTDKSSRARPQVRSLLLGVQQTASHSLKSNSRYGCDHNT